MAAHGGKSPSGWHQARFMDQLVRVTFYFGESPPPPHRQSTYDTNDTLISALDQEQLDNHKLVFCFRSLWDVQCVGPVCNFEGPRWNIFTETVKYMKKIIFWHQNSFIKNNWKTLNTSAESKGRQPKGHEEKEKLKHIQIKCNLLDFHSFLSFFLSSFPFKPTFLRILPAVSFLYLWLYNCWWNDQPRFFIFFYFLILVCRPWRRREQFSETLVWKERRKERKEWKSNKLHLIWISVNFPFSSRPLGCLPLVSVENFTSPSLSRENSMQIKLNTYCWSGRKVKTNNFSEWMF